MNYLERISQLEEQVTNLKQRLGEHQDYEVRELTEEEHNSVSHAMQCHYDRWDYTQERLERGEICPEQAAELRAGA